METARILVLADEPVKAFWDYYNKDRFAGIDLIISCGDLPASYLSFIATMFSGDVLYVPGNHDENYLRHPPEGCINIDNRIFNWHGLRILGLGGSYRYKPGPYQYDEREMTIRLIKRKFDLWRSKGIDMLVTHSPARNINDGDDLPHRGFETFVEILDTYKPQYFVHGHVHMNYGNYPRFTQYNDTVIINAYERFVIEVNLPEGKFTKRKD